MNEVVFMHIIFAFVCLVHPAPGGDKIQIYDDVLTESNLDEITDFVSDILTWKQRSVFAKEEELSGWNTVWHSITYQDVLFSERDSWKSLKQVAVLHLNYSEESHKLWPFNVRGSVLLRGDFPQIRENDDLTAVTLFVFICQNWKKNSYGEMSLFDKNGEYIESIQPRNGRVIVVPSTIRSIVNPPSMNTKQNLMMISLSITSNFESLRVSNPPPEFNDIKFTLSPRESSWQIAKHISKQFQMADSKKIVVYDDVFTQEELNHFLEKIDQGVYNYHPPGHDSEDNVMWILGLDVSNLLKSDLWSILHEAVTITTGSKSYHPYDVSCNNIQTWHHPKTHQDCLDYENDYTLLVYLTPNWTENYYGETIFYNDDEIFAVVRPRFGRLVVFHGTIWHSARPPSPAFKGL